MFNYDDTWLDFLNDSSRFKKIVYQEEKCPSTDKLHIQGYFETYDRTKFVDLLDEFGFSNLEGAKGTPWENYVYCTKNDSATGEFKYCRGEFKEPRSVKRKNTDSIKMITDIQNGADEKTIAITYPLVYLRHCNGIPKLIKFHAEVQKNRSVCVIVLHGSSGTGKSHWARQYAHSMGKKLYSKQVQNEKDIQWFEGYVDQQVLLLDDFDKEQVPYRTFLTWLDIYPITLSVKGSSCQAKWDTVIITSNRDYQAWFPNEYDIKPLKRRIDHTFECDKKYCINYIPFTSEYTSAPVLDYIDPVSLEDVIDEFTDDEKENLMDDVVFVEAESSEDIVDPGILNQQAFTPWENPMNNSYLL